MPIVKSSGASWDEYCANCGYRRGQHGGRCPETMDPNYGPRAWHPTNTFAGSGRYWAAHPGGSAYDRDPGFGAPAPTKPRSVDEYCATCGYREGTHGDQVCPDRCHGTTYEVDRGTDKSKKFRGTGEYSPPYFCDLNSPPGGHAARWPKWGATPSAPATSPKKFISDWPHACPGCGGPAYCGAAPGAAECKRSCRPQYRSSRS